MRDFGNAYAILLSDRCVEWGCTFNFETCACAFYVICARLMERAETGTFIHNLREWNVKMSPFRLQRTQEHPGGEYMYYLSAILILLVIYMNCHSLIPPQFNV